MNTITDRPGVLIASAEEVEALDELALREEEEVQEAIDKDRQFSSITAHILNIFQENKDARITSGIEKKMLESLRAYNGNYDPEDRARIKAAGGSDIFMNLTPTKCRAAMSWLEISIWLPMRMLSP